MANLVFRPPTLRSAFFGLSRLVRAPRILTANRGYSENANPGSKEHIDSLVSAKKLVLFMKGTPEAPRCGFSNLVIQIFKFHGVEDFQAHNVLEDEDLRQGIKDYSNWPTIPQVYMDGEFVGGCDIMLEKHKSGELIEDLSKIGIRSAVLDLEEEKEDEGKENDKK